MTLPGHWSEEMACLPSSGGTRRSHLDVCLLSSFHTSRLRTCRRFVPTRVAWPPAVCRRPCALGPTSDVSPQGADVFGGGTQRGVDACAVRCVGATGSAETRFREGPVGVCGEPGPPRMHGSLCVSCSSRCMPSAQNSLYQRRARRAVPAT